MVNQSLPDTYNELAKSVVELAQSFGMTVDLPNVKFEPPTRQGVRKPYLAMRFMPNGSNLDGLPFDGDVTNVGLMQVSVFWPASEGILKPLGVAVQIADWFRAGWERYTDNTKIAVYVTPTVAPHLQESDLVQVPVTVRWQSSLLAPVAP